MVQDDYLDIYHIFNIRHPQRNRLKQYLLDRGIKTEIHYPVPPHKQKALKNIIKDVSLPISEEIHDTTLSLPISYGHSRKDIYEVVKTINGFE